MDCFSMGGLADIFSWEIVERINDQHYRVKLFLQPVTKNKHRIIHGGVQSLIIDHVAFLITRDLYPNDNFVTTQLTVDYVKMIRDLDLTANIKLDNINDKTGKISVILLNNSQKILTKGTVKFACFFKKVDPIT